MAAVFTFTFQPAEWMTGRKRGKGHASVVFKERLPGIGHMTFLFHLRLVTRPHMATAGMEERVGRKWRES
jgi:hypothetical protein